MEACRYCGYGGGEHSKDCPAYTARAAEIAAANRKQALQETGNEGYRGTQFEYDVFGEVDTKDPGYLADLKKAGAEPNGYLPYAKALELVKHHQPGDPTNPKKDFLRELRLAIIDYRGFQDEDALEDLKVYTAVGTPLDKFHGVDAFISETVDGRETIVTLDATLRKDKLADGHKADVMIGELPSPEADEEEYLDAIADYAEQITKKLNEPWPKDDKAA